MLDFSTAEKQKNGTGLIPRGTIAPVHLTIRPGGAGDGGWLKPNRDGTAQMLDCEFTVISGDYERRKFWTLLTINGETDGQQQASRISASLLRAVLESARGIKPSDEGEKASSGRRVESWGDFDGLRFWAVVGVEKGTGDYPDKNRLSAAVTPDRKEWQPLNGGSAAPSAPATASTSQAVKPASNKPAWA